MINDRVAELSVKGYNCSQTLMQIVGLDALEKEDPDIIKAMGALGYGIGRQLVCGALSGGACALALHAKDREQTKDMCCRLAGWFFEVYGTTECKDILGEGNPAAPRCRGIIENTAQKCMEIIEDME